MKEVDCICGERIVFLDEEVQVKTCTNCGMQVYQYETPRKFETVVRPKRRGLRLPRVYWPVGLLLVVLLAVLGVVGYSVVRAKVLKKAAAAQDRGDAARQRGDLNTAAAAYEAALAGYRRWGAPGESVASVTAALDEVSRALAQAQASQQASQIVGPMPISLEELARQAYLGDPQGWQDEFRREFAGRWVIIRARVEARKGGAFKASRLTVSYRVFGPAGRPVEISFDSPFFERYRVRAGTEMVMRAMFSGMYFDRGGAGEAGHWVLVVDGAKSSFVTEPDELKEVGWKVDQDLATLIARQGSLSPAY